jgi:hypothetical protein
MGDMIDMYRDLKEIDKERRAENRSTGYKALVDAGFGFEAKNGGTHFIVQTDRGRVDYWPGTEKWLLVGAGYSRGLDAFLSHFKPVGEPGERAVPPIPAAQSADVDDGIKYAPHMSEFTLGVYARAGYTVEGAP